MLPLKRWIVAIMAVSMSFLTILCFIYIQHNELSPIICSGSDCTTSKLSSPEEFRRDMPCRRQCFTKACVLTAAALIENVDTIDSKPCIDFHSYSCGNRVPQLPGEDGKLELQIESLFLLALKDALKDVPEKALKPVREIKKFYNHCTEFKSNEELVVSGLIKILADSGISGWPRLSEDWTFQTSDNKTASIDFLLARLEMLKEHNFLYIDYDINKTRDTINGKLAIDISIDVSSRVPMKKAHLHPAENAEALNLHKEKVKNIFDILDIPGENTEHYVTEILELEREIAVWVSNSVSNNQPYERQHLSDNEWGPLVQLLLSMSGISLESLDVHILSSTQSFRKLIEQKSHRVIANYLAYRLVMGNLERLGFFFRGFLRAHVSKFSLARIGEGKPKWKECIIKTAFNFEPALSYWYMSQRMGKHFVPEFEHIFYRIQNMTFNMLADVTWLGQGLRNEIRNYVMAVRSPARNFEVYANASFIEDMYETMKYGEDNFFGISMEYVMFYKRYFIRSRLSKEEKPRLSPNGFLAPNAMVTYDGGMNVGLGIVQFPIFSDFRPRPYNFASLGYVLAHEFAHIIQIFMEQAIARSGVKPREYDEYKACVVNHYSNYKFQFFDTPLRSDGSFAEDFADLLGLAVSYRAFKQAVMEDDANGIKFGVLGIDATENQLFFFLSSQYYCQNMDESVEKIMIEERESHNPNKFRILGMTSNAKEFARAFDCPADSPMNPKAKCNFIH